MKHPDDMQASPTATPTKEVTSYGTKILADGKLIAWECQSINGTTVLKFVGSNERFLKTQR